MRGNAKWRLGVGVGRAQRGSEDSSAGGVVPGLRDGFEFISFLVVGGARQNLRGQKLSR
jgi:hypothetical protein